MQVALANSIASTNKELVAEIARTSEQILEAKRLRYRVYCEERGFEAGRGNIEEDEFDHQSRHVLVRSRLTGEVYGTVRVALSRMTDKLDEFPLEHLCGANALAGLPRHLTGEVSRFAITRDRSGLSPAAAALMRLYLFRGIIEIAEEEGLTHLCALMEKTLIRLLQSTAIYFKVVGPAIEHRGLRHPSTWAMNEGLMRMRSENPAVWSFITNGGGLLAQESEALLLAA